MRDNTWRRGALAAGLYAVLTVAMTWPVVPNLTHSVAGMGGDPWQTMWRFEEKAELAGVPGFWREEFFGGGPARLINLSVWPWMGLQTAFGQPTAYNLVWLMSFWLAGLGMFYLVRTLVREFAEPDQADDFGSEAGAFLAGVMYMFLPYHISHAMGHFGAMQIQWLPWIMLLGTVWMRRPGLWKAAGLAGLLVAQAWSEHHYMLWLGIFGLLAGWFWYLYVKKSGERGMRLGSKKVMLASAVIVFLAGGMMMASYWPTIRLALQETTPLALGKEQTIRFSADLFSYVVPSPWHPLWGEVFEKGFVENFTGNKFESVQFLGWLPLLLIIFFHQHIPKNSKKFWVAAAAVFAVISLGPRLHLLGDVLPIPLPYELIDSWPVLSAVRAVARAGAMVGLASSVLVGWVLATQVKRRQAAGVVLGVLLAEFAFFPVPMQSVRLSPVYERVAGSEGKSLIELPAATNYDLASRALYASNFHGKEVLGSIALERAADEDDLALGRQLPAVKQLLYLRTTDLREGRREFWGQDLTETLPDALAWSGAAGVLVHLDSLSPLQISAVERFLEEAGMVGETVDDAAWYPTAGADWSGARDGVVALRKEGFSHVDYDPERDTTFVRVPELGKVSFVNVSQESKLVRLSLRVAGENTGRADLRWAGERVGAVEDKDTAYRTFDIVVPPGEHELVIDVEGSEALLLQDPTFVVVERG